MAVIIERVFFDSLGPRTRSSLSGHVDGEASLQDLTADRVVAAFKEHGNVITSIWSLLSGHADGQARPSAAH